MGLLFKVVDFLFFITNLVVAFINLLFHIVDFSFKLGFLLSRQLQLLLLCADVPLQLVNLDLKISRLRGSHEQLSVRPQLHVLNLSLVSLILGNNIVLFLFRIVNDLSDHLGKVFLQCFNFLLQLLRGRCLGVHGQLVLVHESVDVHVVSLDRVGDDLLEGLPLVFLVLL